jgi:hypothetical protein
MNFQGRAFKRREGGFVPFTGLWRYSMSAFSNLDQARRVTKIAFILSLTAQAIPLLYSLFTIATPTYYIGPLYAEIRLTILILGLLGALLGILALAKRTRSKALAILSILLCLVAVVQHVLLCGGDALHQKNLLFCPMLWGVRIP